MAEYESSPLSNRRDSIKSSVYNSAASRRKQHAITVGKERREALIRTKRLCRGGLLDNDVTFEGDMIDEEKEGLDTQTSETVESLKSALHYQFAYQYEEKKYMAEAISESFMILMRGKGATQKKVDLLRALRRLLSRSDVPPVEAALQAGAIPALVECLSFGSADEQLLEAAWCLTNIAAGEPEETKALLPALPLLIAHLGEKSSMPVAEQCAWALGNVAGEGEDMRNILLAQGALLPLARLMLSDKGSTARTAAWALSNLIKGPDSKAATELIRINGVLEAIIRHLRKSDDELTTEVAWIVVYLSALSESAVGLLVKTDIGQLLVGRLAASESLQLLIPVLRSLGNLVAADSNMITNVFIIGHGMTDQVISALVKCLENEHRVLKKESAWVLSNIAAGSIEHKKLIFSSEAMPLLIHLLSTSPFDIKKEVAYTLANLCVSPSEGARQPNIILDHLVSLVKHGCLPGFINLVRSADIEGARLGLQFLEIVMRGMPNGEGPKLVEREDGIDAMERFQFHENEDMRTMANSLVDKYFGEDYGLDE